MALFQRIVVAALTLHLGVNAHDHDVEQATSFVDTWTETTRVPYKISDHTANTIGDKIFLTGGCDGDQTLDPVSGFASCDSASNKVAVFSPATRMWSTDVPAAPRARFRHASASIGTKLYLIGGRDVADNLVAEVDVLETSDLTWSTLSATQASPRSDHDAFTVAGDPRLFVVGGYDAAYAAVATVDVLTPDDSGGGAWVLGSSAGASVPPMTTARGDCGVVEHGGKVYVLGGWPSTFCAPFTKVEAYDPAANTWADAPSLLVGRGDKATGVLNGRIFVIGGETRLDCTGSKGADPVNEVEVLDVDAGAAAWAYVGPLPDDKFRFASATYGDSIYVFGGQGNLTYCHDLDKVCNPVTDHTWAFTESVQEHEHDVDDDVEKGEGPWMLVGIVFICLLGTAAIAAVVFFFNKRAVKNDRDQAIKSHFKEHGTQLTQDVEGRL